MTAPADDLRRALRTLSETAPSRDDCPKPERLWEALCGELPPRERRKLVDHVSCCIACAEAWRMARELSAVESRNASTEIAGSGHVPSQTRFGRIASHGPASFLGKVAAAILLLLAVGLFMRQLTVREEAYRDPERLEVETLVPEDEPLSRELCVLRWSPGPAGSRYDVRVMTKDLELLASVEGLDTVSYTVPEASLEELPFAAELLWQVEVVLPGGDRMRSRTFVSQIR